MEKGLAVVLKEVMEVDPMLTMLTENQYLFHLGLLRQCPPRCRPHTTPPATPEDPRSQFGFYCTTLGNYRLFAFIQAVHKDGDRGIPLSCQGGVYLQPADNLAVPG